MSLRVIAETFVEPQSHGELIVALLVLGNFVSPDQEPNTRCQGVNGNAKIRRARAIDIDAQFLLRRLEVGVDVHNSRDGSDFGHQVGDVNLELLDIGSLDQYAQPVAAAAASAPRRRRWRRRKCPSRRRH